MPGWVTLLNVQVMGQTGYEVVLIARARPPMGGVVNENLTVRVYVPLRHIRMDSLVNGKAEVSKEWAAATALYYE